eukprot:15353999-Ditylum_brightwellii.AAC.1
MHLSTRVCRHEESEAKKEGEKYDKMNVSNLKIELKSRSLSTSGLKNNLIMRLRQDDIKNNGPTCQEEDDMLVLTSLDCEYECEEDYSEATKGDDSDCALVLMLSILLAFSFK